MWHVDFEDVQGHPGDKIGDDDANDDDEVDGDDDDLTYELIECGGLTSNPTNRPNQKSFLAEEILHSTYSVSNYGNGTITFEAGNVALWIFFGVPQNFCLEFINHQPYFRCFVF